MIHRVKNALSLHEFMHNREVLRLYRALLRTVKHDIDGIDTVRAQFKAHKSATDPISIKALMTDARRALEQLDRGPTGNNKPEADSWLNGSTDGDIRGRVGEGWPWQRDS